MWYKLQRKLVSMWLSVTIFYVNSFIFPLRIALSVVLIFKQWTSSKNGKLFQQNLIIAINWNKSLLMSYFFFRFFPWSFLTKGNAFHHGPPLHSLKLYERSAFIVQTCLLFTPCAMLINFYIWLFLAIFSSIYSHRIESTASAWEQCYTLVYFMVVCSCWITSKPKKKKQTSDDVYCITFRTKYKFRCIFHSICLCVSSFKLTNKFHFQFGNLHRFIGSCELFHELHCIRMLKIEQMARDKNENLHA